MSRKVKLLLIVFLSLPELFGLGAWAVGSYQDRANERITKQNLHEIQLAIEIYNIDDPCQSYPFDLQGQRFRKYMAQFPTNPYARRAMHLLLPGDSPVAGDFSYLTSVSPHGDCAAVVDRYNLVGYGKATQKFPMRPKLIENADKIDGKRVLIILDSGWQDRAMPSK